MQHRGETYWGNRCFRPRVYVDGNGAEKCISASSVLSAKHPEYALYFGPYHHVPTEPINASLDELQHYASMNTPQRTLNRLILASRIISNSNDIVLRYRAHQFQLTHLMQLINVENAPHDAMYVDGGILPPIPLDYTWMITNDGKDVYGNRPIAEFGVMGEMIRILFNKNLRLVCAKRENEDMCLGFIQAHPHMWFYLMDIVLLYVMLGLFYPHPFYPLAYYLSPPVATVAALYCRRMAFHYDAAWLKTHYNFIVFGICNYLYDQVDGDIVMRETMDDHYQHHTYMLHMKEYANKIRCFVQTAIEPHASAMIASWNAVHSAEFGRCWDVWHRCLDGVNSLIEQWYDASMSPKCISTVNYFDESVLIYSTFLDKAASVSYKFSEPLHQCILQCAIFTVRYRSAIPLFALFRLFNFDVQFYDCIDTILYKLIEGKNSKEFFLKGYHAFLAPFSDELQIIIEYFRWCRKLMHIEYFPTHPRMREVQLAALENNRTGVFGGTASTRCMRICRNCMKPRTAIAESVAAREFGPFTNLRDQTLPALVVGSSRNNPYLSDRIGISRKDNTYMSMALNDLICCKTKKINGEVIQHYMCHSMPLMWIDMLGFFVHIDRTYGMCCTCAAISCVESGNFRDGYFYCNNHNRTNIQFAFYAYFADPLRAPKPHHVCAWGVCLVRPSTTIVVLDATGVFTYFPLCDFHHTHCKITQRVVDIQRIQQTAIEKSKDNRFYYSARYTQQKKALPLPPQPQLIVKNNEIEAFTRSMMEAQWYFLTSQEASSTYLRTTKACASKTACAAIRLAETVGVKISTPMQRMRSAEMILSDTWVGDGIHTECYFCEAAKFWKNVSRRSAAKVACLLPYVKVGDGDDSFPAALCVQPDAVVGTSLVAPILGENIKQHVYFDRDTNSLKYRYF